MAHQTPTDADRRTNRKSENVRNVQRIVTLKNRQTTFENFFANFCETEGQMPMNSRN